MTEHEPPEAPPRGGRGSGERPRRRWPGWVYDGGTEPDPRFSLANERTFLAWLRTGLALLASGVALEAVEVPPDETLRVATSLLVIVLGMLAASAGWFSWLRSERALRRQEPLHGPTSAAVIGAGLVLVAILLIVGILVGT